MLPKLFADIEKNSDCKLKKFVNARDVSNLGAFVCGTVIDLEFSVTRALGARGVVMRIARDGCADTDIPLEFSGSDGVHDIYTLSIDTDKLCKNDGYGLFYYELLLLRGYNTLFTDTYNNFDFELAEREGSRFRLLVFERDYKLPTSFGAGVMYHVFVDRFYRGSGDYGISCRDDAVMNPDWEGGIPQYAKIAGEALKNNEFFGGTLYGVAEKLDYLNSLGVKTIYLSPIFEAYSNHKYDTGNYLKVDEMFGGDDAFSYLLSRAKEYGMGIILDGVFNHTGDDSLYFNKRGRYGDGGAYNDECSPYRNWYFFKTWPNQYESWWGIEILPKLNHENESCRALITGPGGVIEKYTRMGIAGWRLDVADELSDTILDEIRAVAKRESGGEAVIIGEVWENACDKISYGNRRRYLSGRQLDSVMNYPLKNAIVSFCQFGDAEMLYNTLTEIYASYPREVSNRLMNLLGTHDTERILTVLGSDFCDLEGTNDELSVRRLDKEKRKIAVSLLKIAAAIQYTVYGIPSVYYGDEVGLEGFHDPFCRMPFPWHEVDEGYRADILGFYRKLGEIRRDNPVLSNGDFTIIRHTESSVVYARENSESMILVVANRGERFELDLSDGHTYIDLFTDEEHSGSITVDADSVVILKMKAEGEGL